MTEIVKHPAVLEYYRDGNLYYSITVDNKVKYTFTIDITNTEDIGNATFERDMKGITLMRYIRKSIAGESLIEETL